MPKYKVACPNCGKPQEYSILTRNYDNQKCKDCGQQYRVDMEMPLIILMLLLFAVSQILYAAFLVDYISVFAAFVLGIAIVFFGSIGISLLISKRWGSQFFFKTTKHTPKKGKQIR